MYWPHRCAAIAVCLIALTTPPALAGDSEVQVVRTRAFKIPFDFDAVQWRQNGINSAQLLVSRNQGRTWIADSVARGADKAFVYEADADGEYWFCVRPVSATLEEAPPSPELKVRVDTAVQPIPKEIVGPVEVDRKSPVVTELPPPPKKIPPPALPKNDAIVDAARNLGPRIIAGDAAIQRATADHDDTVKQPRPIHKPRPLPAVRKARLLNKLEFDIGYSVDSVGTSGVGNVELFITENNGKKWYRYGFDSDRKSPFRVKVPRDGTYGFWVRIHSGAGLADAPPEQGEKPQISVQVDRTAPAAKWSHPYRRGNVLSLLWKAEDKNPVAVFLAWSANSKGPWTPISGWVQNSGRFDWDLSTQRNLPSKVFLQLTARDEAGNVASVGTPAAVLLDVSRPKGRLVGVELQP